MHLTTEQIEAVKNGEPIRCSLPEVGEEVVIVRSDTYDALLDDEREQQAFGRFARKEAVKIAKDQG